MQLKELKIELRSLCKTCLANKNETYPIPYLLKHIKKGGKEAFTFWFRITNIQTCISEWIALSILKTEMLMMHDEPQTSPVDTVWQSDRRQKDNI
jgi:hypothetical protein